MNLESISKTVLGTGPEPTPVKIKIPRDHPAAPMLKQLFIALATEERTASGIYIKQTGTNGKSVRQVLEALRDVLASEGIDLDKMAQEILNFKHAQPLEGILDNPLLMSKMIVNAFGGDVPATPQVREHHLKRAKATIQKIGEDELL